jgi:hypothetical protein
MTFSDLDLAEVTLGKPVTSMTDTELVTYLKLSVRHHQGIELSVDGIPERAVMASLKRTYGHRAGQIVKWAAWRHDSQFKGQIIGYFSFTKGRKWFCDMLDTEMQQHLKVEATQAVSDQAAAGLARLADL